MNGLIDKRALSTTRPRSTDRFLTSQQSGCYIGVKSSSYLVDTCRTVGREMDGLTVSVLSMTRDRARAVSGYIFCTEENVDSTVHLHDIDFTFSVSSDFSSKRNEQSSASTAPRMRLENSEVRQYIEKIYLLEENGQHRAASKVIFSFVERRFMQENLADVNAMLVEIDIKKLSIWSISGLIRVTSRAKMHFPLVWRRKLHEARAFLASEGEDVAGLFAGL